MHRPMELASQLVKNGRMVFVSFMSACGTGASGRETAWSCSQIAGFSAEPPVFFDRNLRGERTTPSMARCWLSDTPQVATPIRRSAVQPTIGIGVAGTFTDTCGVTIGTVPVGEASRFSARRRTSLPISTGKTYSAACSSGATRGRMIWIRVPPPGSESRSSRPPRRLLTML
jgi:hypothetical protein